MKWLSRLLTALLCLCVLCAASRAEDDSIIVSVGQRNYNLSEAQMYYDALADSACKSNGVAALTQEQAEQLRDAVVKQYVFQGIVQNMYVELGLDAFTPEEEAELREQVKAQSDELIASILEELRKNYSDASEEKLREYAIATMELQGVTEDALYESAKENALLTRITNYVSPNLTITDEQVEEAYVEQYIEQEKTAFGDNIYMYELYMYNYDYSPRYIPEGFRYCKRIVLAVPEAIQDELDAQQTLIDDAYAAVASSETELEKLEGADEVAQLAANDVFQEANRAYDSSLDGLEAIKSKALEAVKPTTDEIANKRKDGATFESLMDAYTSEEGITGDSEPFLLHAQSYFCDEIVRDAAMALTSPGDMTEPLFTDAGIQLIYYVSDAPAYLPMDEPMRQAVYDTLLETTQYEALIKRAEEWQSRFEVFTYPELIDMTYATTERQERTTEN